MLERGLAALDRFTQDLGAELNPHLKTGLSGEDAAFFHLRRKGYTVVARRWSAGNIPGDLDLIAWHGPLLCFIEVKTRTAHDIAPAESAVNRHKQFTLRRLARAFLAAFARSGATAGAIRCGERLQGARREAGDRVL